ncbi:PREDICTED: uncharacterized protein LOC100633479 [Amphimedon queenslandica]|uniref:Uncharacterized protein n=1 Tax=Amphimedon queenslandica TaxID=400682 RepID=A0A1X7TV86_AMPQE|nr:PREDICTED: uncharacterized protein LOC100633479 [Amphimedon queenslandica]|eukprot:XP_003389744.2 PREDICTED: uncharacterized protein LOC100633479 [Amphimedon queenslandica]
MMARSSETDIKETVLVLSSKIDSTYVRLFKLSLLEFGIGSGAGELTFFQLFDGLFNHESFRNNPSRAVSFTCHVLSRFSCESSLYSSLQDHGKRRFSMRDEFPWVDCRLRAVELLYNLKESARLDAINDLIENHLGVAPETVNTITDLVMMMFQREIVTPDQLAIIENYSNNSNTLTRNRWRGRKPPDVIIRKEDEDIKKDVKKHKRKIILGFIFGFVSAILLVTALVSYSVTFFIQPQSSSTSPHPLILTQPSYKYFINVTNPTEIELITNLTTPLSVHTFPCDETSTSTTVLSPFSYIPMNTSFVRSQSVDYREITTGIQLLAGSRLVYTVNVTIQNESVCPYPLPQPPDPDDCLNLFLFNSSEEINKFSDPSPADSSSATFIDNSSFCFETLNDFLSSELIFHINNDGIYFVGYNYSSTYCTTLSVTVSGSAVNYEAPSDSTQVCSGFSITNNCTITSSCSPFCITDERTCLYVTNSSVQIEEGYIAFVDSPGLFYNYRVFTFFAGVAVSLLLFICVSSCLLCCCLFCCCSLYDCLKEEGPYDSNCI